jgi:hypothetical protein
MWGALAGLAVALTCLVLTGDGRLVAASQDAQRAASDASPHRVLISRYCATCHNQKTATAQLMLDIADVDRVGREPQIWEKVVRRLRAGQMPPAGIPRPDKATIDTFVKYLETELDLAATANPNPGRPPAFHRLNRAEYANAIRDLLAVDIDANTLLPVDDSGYGFDNVADILSTSPILVEAYISAAAKVSQLAIGSAELRPYTETYYASRRLVQDDRMDENLPFGTRGGMTVKHLFPFDGEYIVKIRLQRNKEKIIRGLGEPHQLDVRLDGALVKQFSVGGEHQGRSGVMNTVWNSSFWGDAAQRQYELSADDGLEVRLRVTAGNKVVGVAFLKENAESETEALPAQTLDEVMVSGYKGGLPSVDTVAISGPYNSNGRRDTASRRKIFVCRPKGSGDEELCAKQILTMLAHRAYRRSVTDKDIQPLLGLFTTARGEGGFETAIGTALQGLLVSPEFLFRTERDPAGLPPDTAYRISDLELASRLSFFLWSSIPDEQLLGMAETGRLKEPAVLQKQVQRMLRDPRSKALVTNFAGQWLSLRTLQTVSPDPRVAPDFDDNLKDALRTETELFFENLVANDRPILELLDADYTFLNERLARHYGIPDVYGSHFRRVTLRDERRRGLLGHGSLLTVTSYPNRTAPTLRGAWILDNLQGTPPPPPPPNVPALSEEDRVEGERQLTMRERMDRHRVNPSCAGCHKNMDPLGFALENFDSLGRLRDSYDGTPIDASGALPDGEQFLGPVGLRKVLLSHPEQFVHTFTEKLLTYALGRGIEFYDEPTVRQIMRETAGNQYRMDALIVRIVMSQPFQMRRSHPS